MAVWSLMERGRLAPPRGSCFPEIAGDVPGQRKRERAEPLRKTSVALGQKK